MMERDEDDGNDDEDDGFLFFLEEDSENMSQQDVADDYAFLFQNYRINVKDGS